MADPECDAAQQTYPHLWTCGSHSFFQRLQQASTQPVSQPAPEAGKNFETQLGQA